MEFYPTTQSSVKILSIFVAFLENMNFKRLINFSHKSFLAHDPKGQSRSAEGSQLLKKEHPHTRPIQMNHFLILFN